MALPREHPYIWATWLARLLAGEAHCEWAGWFLSDSPSPLVRIITLYEPDPAEWEDYERWK